MKAYINRNVVVGPWGGGNLFVRAFHEMAPREDVEVMQDPSGNINPEVILLVGLENDNQGGISAEQAIMYKMYVKPDCKIVLRVNENDARKGTSDVDEMLRQVSMYVDHTVFVSHWLQDYFMKQGWTGPNSVIYNGVQRSVFAPQPKLNNGKVNIVAHHWSDNRMKGADIYEKLDELVAEHPDRFNFTYIGRHKCDFKNTTVIRPLSGKALGDELGKHDVYVSASRFDPGPNHILEALACELPTYVHSDGGGAVEFAGVDHSYSSWDELKSTLLNGSFTKNKAFVPPSWKDCINEYVATLDRINRGV